MLYCPNPNCSNPFNPDSNKFCLRCGQILTPLFRNRFRVIKLLGEGGFGKTYEARDVDKMDEPCVIKQFFPQVQGTAALEKATELFKQEAKRLYDLGEHPQIPRLIAYFEQDQRLYLVQEFIDGHNLLQELQQQGTFSEAKIIQLLKDLLPVLQFIHEQGVIHRDIKPENIMRRHKDGQLMLIDFGVSKQTIGTIIGKVGTTVGTHGYVPLEQMRGQVFPASDLYSLGVTCIRLLTGCFPKADGYDELYDALNGKWIWKENLLETNVISQNFANILDTLIHDYINNRYQTAVELIEAINIHKFPGNKKLILEPNNSQSFGSNANNVKVSGFTPHLNLLEQEDYSRLDNLLKSSRWEDANEETFDILLKLAGREKQGSLYVNDIQELSCQDLQVIDRLWVEYSDGKFGLSIQKQIWLNINGRKEPDTEDWCRFGYEVGWLKRKILRKTLLFFADLFSEDNPVWFEELNFSIKAPKGHLPCLKSIGVTSSIVNLILLRCEDCGL